MKAWFEWLEKSLDFFELLSREGELRRNLFKIKLEIGFCSNEDSRSSGLNRYTCLEHTDTLSLALLNHGCFSMNTSSSVLPSVSTENLFHVQTLASRSEPCTIHFISTKTWSSGHTQIQWLNWTQSEFLFSSSISLQSSFGFSLSLFFSPFFMI